jgi:hypothetical protein
VAGRTYAVPLWLIGHAVEMRCYANELEVYKAHWVETLPRLRGEGAARIDYRHIIGSLVRKPGAFAAYRYREELFPSLTFRQAYDALRARRGERADVPPVAHPPPRRPHPGVLGGAGPEGFWAHGVPLDYAAVRAQVQPEAIPVPEVSLAAPNLAA